MVEKKKEWTCPRKKNYDNHFIILQACLSLFLLVKSTVYYITLSLLKINKAITYVVEKSQ